MNIHPTMILDILSTFLPVFQAFKDRRDTIKSQKQARNLQWGPKRLELLQAIKDDSSINEDELKYYFGPESISLYQAYLRAKQEFNNATLSYNSFFPRVEEQFLTNDDSLSPEDFQKREHDISMFQQLADGYEQFGSEMSSASKEQFSDLNRRYSIYCGPAPEEVPDWPEWLSYIEVSTQLDDTRNEFNKKKKHLIDALDHIISAPQ